MTPQQNGLVAAGIGLMVLLFGWGAGVDWFLTLNIPASATMKPLTCWLLIAMGLGIFALAADRSMGKPASTFVLGLSAIGWVSIWFPWIQSPSPVTLTATTLIGVAMADIRCPHAHLGAVLALLSATTLILFPVALWMLTGMTSALGFGPMPGIAIHTSAALLFVVRACIQMGDPHYGER